MLSTQDRHWVARSGSARASVPDAGDLIWLAFSPQTGHERAGHRPALVLSPASYNGKTGLMVCCPMTSQIKGYPFEVIVSRKPPSAVLADQVKSLDWRARRAVSKTASHQAFSTRSVQSCRRSSVHDEAYGRKASFASRTNVSDA